MRRLMRARCGVPERPKHRYNVRQSVRTESRRSAPATTSDTFNNKGLSKETDNQETMPVMIDSTLVQVPFHYEKNTGGKMVKVPELVGEFVDIKRLESTMPEYVTAYR